MEKKSWTIILLVPVFLLTGLVVLAWASNPEATHSNSHSFPPALESYEDGHLGSITEILKHRIGHSPFNLIATIIFLCAILHTFLSSKFNAIANRRVIEHKKKIKRGEVYRNTVDIPAGIFHFLGEVEVVFGIWAIALGAAIISFYDWHTLVGYISHKVNFTEAIFVVTIMTLASTRPILKLAEGFMALIANLFGGTLAAWWLTLLTIGPLLGSLITEPAAMTIVALLLAQKLYDMGPSTKLKYASIGLLFVNVSIGGTLTHFAAPPVLMVAGPWGWGVDHMLLHFGWKAVTAILLSNTVYFLMFRKELAELQEKYALKYLKDEIQGTYLVHRDLDAEIEQVITGLDPETFLNSMEENLENKIDEIKTVLGDQLKERYADSLKEKGIDISYAEEAFEQRFEEIKLLHMRKNFAGLLPEEKKPDFRDPLWDTRDDPVPLPMILIHAGFMIWTIFNVHHAPFVVGGLLFFLGFAKVTSFYQNQVDLKPPLLVGFFLAGLVVHGGVQAWWIAPVLGNLQELPLLLAASGLTAFNDNAAITFLGTLVPGFTEELKYAILAGAVSGGGLTVIANAPNPAGQSLLKGYFENGVSPVGLLKAALLPTVMAIVVFLVLS